MTNNWTYSGTATYPRMISEAYADLLQENERLRNLADHRIGEGPEILDENEKLKKEVKRIDILQNINRDNHIIIHLQNQEIKELERQLAAKPTFQYPTAVGILGVGAIEIIVFCNPQRTALWSHSFYDQIPVALRMIFGSLKHYGSMQEIQREWLDIEAIKREFLGT